MKRLLLVLVFLMIAVAFLVVLPSDKQFFSAVPGCCKERKTYSNPWRKNKLDFGECKNRNREKDGKTENVFDSRGYVWWDRRC